MSSRHSQQEQENETAYDDCRSLGLLATTPQAAKSDYVNLKSKGNWTAFYTVSNQGNPLCGMTTYWLNNRDGTAATAHLKYTSGSVITVQLFKSGWRIPKGTTVNVSISFDNSQQFAVGAKSGIYENDAYLQFDVKEGTEADLLGLIADAREFKINFPDGDEPTWVGKMYGSREVSDAFRRCAFALDKNAPTQPTGKAAPTQPTKPMQPATKRDDGSV